MLEYERAYDISIRLGVESVSWPGDPEYSRRLHASMAEGGLSDVSLLTMTAHTGTHVDTPGHFIAGGRKLDDFGPERFILPAVVVEVAGEGPIGPAALAGAAVPAGGAILFKTANSRDGRIASGAFFEDGVYLSLDAAGACLARGASLVGLDYFTLDAYGDLDFPAHRLLLGADALVLETINLRGVEAGDYTLICLPLRLAGSEASPVRAVLLR